MSLYKFGDNKNLDNFKNFINSLKLNIDPNDFEILINYLNNEKQIVFANGIIYYINQKNFNMAVIFVSLIFNDIFGKESLKKLSIYELSKILLIDEEINKEIYFFQKLITLFKQKKSELQNNSIKIKEKFE